MYQKAFEEATTAVLRRMARDRERISPLAQEMLDELRERLFGPDVDFERARRHRGAAFRLRHATFTNEIELPPTEYLLEARLEIALRLLQATDMPPAEAGRLAGFGDPAAFREACLQVLELPPRRLRELFRPPPEPAADDLPPPLSPAERAHYAGRLARETWKRLRTLPFDRARDVLRDQVLLGEPHLFGLLSRESRRQGRRDPHRGVELAELALATVEGSAPLLGDRTAALREQALDRLSAARERAAGRAPNPRLSATEN